MNWLENYPLAPLTSYHVGGKARYFFAPQNLSEWQTILQLPPPAPITLLGNASNVLIRDGGILGAVIYLGKMQPSCQEEQGLITATAGTKLAQLVNYTIQLGYSDLLNLTGIPGTIGGALRMNAGAYGNTFWQFVQKITLINTNGILVERPLTTFNISYREINGLGPLEWFAKVGIRCKNQETVTACRTTQQTILLRRRSHQPLNYPSCGSVFRNPPQQFAAQLIEACGLKGCRIGNAQISHQHANFFINLGQATAADLEALIQLAINTVRDRFAITLVPEVKILGEL